MAARPETLAARLETWQCMAARPESWRRDLNHALRQLNISSASSAYQLALDGGLIRGQESLQNLQNLAWETKVCTAMPRKCTSLYDKRVVIVTTCDRHCRLGTAYGAFANT